MIFNVQTHNIIENIQKELQNVKKKEKRNILVFSRLYTDNNSTSML